MEQLISFICWEKDELLEVQLEPEAILFKVMPGSELTFAAESNKEFKWTIRVDNNTKAVQVFPETLHPFQLRIYENAQLLEDWYKYM